MSPRESVRVRVEADVAVLVVHGRLDAAAGRRLVEATAACAGGDVNRIDLDLHHVESFSAEGAAALVACRAAAGPLGGGLHYRTSRGAGRDALLAAYAESA